MIGRLRPADLVAGLGGLVLLASLFLPWYGGEVLVTGGPPLAVETSAWEAFAVFDVLLALLALVPGGLLALQATNDSPSLPVLFSALSVVAGALATLLVLSRILFEPGPDALVAVEWGAWLALAAAAVLALGAWRSLRDERMPGTPPPVPERQPAPVAGP